MMHTKRNKGILRRGPDRPSRKINDRFCNRTSGKIDNKEAIDTHETITYTLDDLKAYNDSFPEEVKLYVDKILGIQQGDHENDVQPMNEPINTQFSANNDIELTSSLHPTVIPLTESKARQSDQSRLSEQFQTWTAPVKKTRWRDRIAHIRESRQSRNMLAGLVVGTLALIGSVAISKGDSVDNFTIPEATTPTSYSDDVIHNTDLESIDYTAGSPKSEPTIHSTAEVALGTVHDSHHTEMGVLTKLTLNGPQVSNTEARIIAPNLLPWNYSLALFNGDPSKVNDYIETVLLIYNAEKGTSYNYDLNGTGMFIDKYGHVMSESEVPGFNQLSSDLFSSYISA